MVITRQYQNTFIWLCVAAEFVQQRLKLVVRQQGYGFFISRPQTIKRLGQLMGVLLNKAVRNFANSGVKAVGGIQIAAIAFAKIVMERGGQ